MPDQTRFEEILKAVAGSPKSGFELRSVAMGLLDGLDTYDWSGVYRLEGDHLELDAYRGAATDHTRIKVGVGVCGTAVVEDRNQVIEDVWEIENYLSCSVSTRSEIVVLIRDAAGGVLGQIDIDGHQVGAFAQDDELFLERLGAILAERWA